MVVMGHLKKHAATSGLARMNMIPHDDPTAEIR